MKKPTKAEEMLAEALVEMAKEKGEERRSDPDFIENLVGFLSHFMIAFHCEDDGECVSEAPYLVVTADMLDDILAFAKQLTNTINIVSDIEPDRGPLQ